MPPSCAKFTNSGWVCDDYLCKRPATSKLPSELRRDLRLCLILKVPGFQKDRRMLHHSCVQRSEDVAGFLPSESDSSSSYSSHQEPVFRQALVALDYLHSTTFTRLPSLDYLHSTTFTRHVLQRRR
ncbi:hypothetical protein F5Y18DRAFT_384357 [Xylariaceae sp. FL1019]|nr:hypothetical protein F5Y18DRAFT_384357 [Xylariaceae sp. FL1019]